MSGEVDLVDNLKKADLIFRRALRCRSENEAIVLLDKALILDPGNANIFAVRSIKLSILGRFPEAIEDYKNAVNLKVETIFRLQAKALIEIYEGNFSESIKLLDEYISEAWSRIVDYESRAKKIFSLWISWEKQYFDEYNLAYALYLRATALYMAERLEESLKSLDASLEISNDKRLGQLVAEIRSKVEKKKIEQEKKYKSTTDYKLKNIVRIFIAVFAWYYATLSKYAGISFVLVGILSVPVAISVQMDANNSVNLPAEYIHLQTGDADSSSAGVLWIGAVSLVFGACIICLRDGKKSPIDKFPIPQLESFCNKQTGLSIFDVIGKKRF